MQNPGVHARVRACAASTLTYVGAAVGSQGVQGRLAGGAQRVPGRRRGYASYGCRARKRGRGRVRGGANKGRDGRVHVVFLFGPGCLRPRGRRLHHEQVIWTRGSAGRPWVRCSHSRTWEDRASLWNNGRRYRSWRYERIVRSYGPRGQARGRQGRRCIVCPPTVPKWGRQRRLRPRILCFADALI